MARAISCAALAAVAGGRAAAQCSFDWADGFGIPGNGVNDAATCMTVFDDDGPGPHPPMLYVGGWFNSAGGMSVGHVAAWDGQAWHPLGSGTDGRYIDALEVYDDGSGPALYAGGEFGNAGGAPAGNIARWNGTSWSALGPGVNSHVFALRAHNDGSGPALFAGGDFTSARANSTMRIAKWNGSAWSALGPGMNGNQETVQAFAVYNGVLHAGGFFHVVGNFVARWNGFSWSTLGGTGMDSTVYALCVGDEAGSPILYAGGYFDHAAGVTVNRVARWNGSAWSSMAGGIGSAAGAPFIYALTMFDDGTGPALYAGGSFTTKGGVPANSIAKWSGTAWTPLGSGIGGSFPWVYALGVYDDGNGAALYAGGPFGSAGGRASNGFAKWGCALCYANCDSSTVAPVLNINDFICFLNRFASGNAYANCDHSTTPPILNINDFICFLNRFAAGCS